MAGEIGKAYEGVHEAAHILADHEERSGAAVRRAYEDPLEEMARRRGTLGTLAPAIDHFRKATAGYAGGGLFRCYDIPGLPRTNDDPEQRFLAPHAITSAVPPDGRRGTVPGVIVRGAVRVIAAAVARRCQRFRAPPICEPPIMRHGSNCASKTGLSVGGPPRSTTVSAPARGLSYESGRAATQDEIAVLEKTRTAKPA